MCVFLRGGWGEECCGVTCRGCCPDWEFSHNTALTEESQLQQNGATPSSNNRKLVDLVQKFAMMANWWQIAMMANLPLLP